MVYSNGFLYSAGGNNNSGAQSTLYAYNISNNTWTQKTSMPLGRANGASAIVGSKFFVIGGDQGNLNYMYQT